MLKPKSTLVAKPYQSTLKLAQKRRKWMQNNAKGSLAHPSFMF